MKLTNTFLFKLLLFIIIFSNVLAKSVQGFPSDKIRVGLNYVVWEAEATDSPLGKWEIITPDDSRYKDNGDVSPINETHLEFTGNNPGVGPANSPLTYKITCPKTGKYRLTARMYQRLEGLPADKCNDVYVKMEGDFTSGNDVALDDLKHNQKLYGRGVNRWGALTNLEIHSTGAHRPALYNLKEGEVYTLTVSGRAQRTNIDYWILFETTIEYNVGSNVDLAAENPEEYWPLHNDCQTIAAIDMKFKDIDGFIDAKTDNKAGLDILQIPDRMAWAAAQHSYQGSDAFVDFTLKSMQEKDGESTYRLKVNGKLIGEATNDRIQGTNIGDYTIQAHEMNQNPVALERGDIIQIEFNNTTNGLVPEGDLTATSRGRWHSLDICASLISESYGIILSEEEALIVPGDSVLLIALTSFPDNIEDSLVWTTSEPGIATVDDKGLVVAHAVGTALIRIQSTGGEYQDSCIVNIVVPSPYGGEPANVPGIIEAEDYDIGGQGITFFDHSEANKGGKYREDEVDIAVCSEGGFNVMSIEKGEWLQYSIIVEEEGYYNIKTRLSSSNATMKYSYQINNEDITSLQSVSLNSDNNTFVTSTSEKIYLNAGKQTLKLIAESNDWNINWIRIEKNIPLTAMVIDRDSLSMIITHRFKLNPVFTPENCTNQELIWSSSNADVASVDITGNIRANSQGEAIITAESAEGNFTATCIVSVDIDRSLLRISMEENDIDIMEGDSIQLSVVFVPEYASNKNVSWESSNPEVALVDITGILIGITPGNAVVKVESEEGEHNALCFVEVLADPNVASSDLNTSLVKVYPNPCGSYINIVQGNNLPIKKILLMKTNGQVVKEQEVMGEKKIQMKVSEHKGTYLLLLKGDSQIQSLPIIIE